MPISSHSHSGQFCKHAFCELEEIVLRAIEVGFTHYGLSEHMPRYEPEDLYEEEIEVRFIISLSQCIGQIEASTCPPRATPRAFDFFENYCSNSPLPEPKCRSNAPH